MDAPTTLRAARERAGLTQAALAERTGTSQATISAYEGGRKQPSVDTLSRLLAATGQRLAVEAGKRHEPSREQHRRTARVLADVLALAEALPPTATRRRGASLQEKLVAVHQAFTRRRVPHAFGGAIALAYWTLEPRGTRDIDLNVFVPASEAERVLRALPEGVAQPEGTVEMIVRDHQIRLWWDDTPVDLFLDDDADRPSDRRTVPFGSVRIPVLGPMALATTKLRRNRTRDWADLEAMAAAGALDTAEVRALTAALDARDWRLGRLEAAATAGGG